MDSISSESLESKVRFVTVTDGHMNIVYENGKIDQCRELEVLGGRAILNGSLVKIVSVSREISIYTQDVTFLIYLDGKRKMLWQDEWEGNTGTDAKDIRDIVMTQAKEIEALKLEVEDLRKFCEGEDDEFDER